MRYVFSFTSTGSVHRGGISSYTYSGETSRYGCCPTFRIYCPDGQARYFADGDTHALILPSSISTTSVGDGWTITSNSHSHTFAGTAHNHTYANATAGGTLSSITHSTHTFNTTSHNHTTNDTTSSGTLGGYGSTSPTAIDNRPLYYTLCFIMKA